MDKPELATLTDLRISNITSKRLREILDSMTYETEMELIAAIRNYATTSHTAEDVRTKSERLLAAVMAPIYIYEEAKVRGDL
jgi:hypothetical protein